MNEEDDGKVASGGATSRSTSWVLFGLERLSDVLLAAVQAIHNAVFGPVVVVAIGLFEIGLEGAVRLLDQLRRDLDHDLKVGAAALRTAVHG